MASNLPRKAERYRKEHSRHRLWQRVVSGLACAVVFCTTYALILPAITMEQETFCALEEHQHGPGCWEKRLICEIPEEHFHTDACHAEEKTLICSLEESEGPDGAHRHGESCYETEDALICGIEEDHVHTDTCYEQVLICNMPEHAHSLACCSNPAADVETREDWEHTLETVALTGNWSKDVLAVAGSQLGYTESEKNYLVSQDTQAINGYTRYGAWYGDAYADWSAIFAAFCLSYAQIPGDQMPQDADYQKWIEKLSGQEAGYAQYDLYRASESYAPTPGDLVFFDRDQDGKADHVGFVESLLYDEGTEITVDQAAPTGEAELVELRVIEGDAGDQVQRVTYRTAAEGEKDGKSMESVMGYAILPKNTAQDVIPNETAQDAPVQEYTWQSEDGAVSLAVSFDGLNQTNSTLDGELLEEASPVLWPELNREDDVSSLLSNKEEADVRPLMTLRLRLMRGDEEIDLSDCTANVSLTATRELIQGPAAASNAAADTEKQSDTLSVIDGDGNELTAGTLDQEKTTLHFTMRANEPVAVNVVSNPNFTVQHYLRYQKVKLARDSTLTNVPQLEFIDTSINGVFESAVDMQVREGLTLNNSTVVQGQQGAGLNPNNGSLPDTFKINLVPQGDSGVYRFEVETALEALFMDEQTTYRRNPQILYMNRLYNGQDSYNAYYTLDEVWVYQPPRDGTAKDTASLTDSDFIKYDLPLLSGDASRHDPEKIRFTNNPSNTHISQLDANGVPIATEATEEYPYVYTVLIQEGTVVRLVFNGTEDVDYTTENVQLFDYDATDGFIYRTEADARGQTNQVPTSQQNDNLWFANTLQKGINSPENFTEPGIKFAFGNGSSVLDTGLGDLTWNGNTLNMGNVNSYGKATFGLVKGLNYGTQGYPRPEFSSDIVAPNLFSSALVAGKTAYLQDYKLNFHRMGSTYILNSVIKKGDGETTSDETVLANLRDFRQTAIAWSTKLPIYSNEFWPLDDSPSHGTDGHDLKFGKLALRENRKAIVSSGNPKSFPNTDINTADHNAYLGMSYHVYFDVVPGYCARMNYWFYGDDDMWVFLEEVDEDKKVIGTPKLIADIGGIHPSVGEYVNLWEYVPENPLFLENPDGSLQRDANGNLIENQEVHHYRMTVFYTERGASGSTCYMRFNLPALTSITPSPERNEALVFEKRLLGMDASEVPYDSPDNQDFNFLLTLTNANGTSYEDVYDYAIYSREATPDHSAPDAQPLRSGTIGTADSQSGKYVFTLKGGEYIVISNLPDNTYYTIEETISQDYVTYFQKGTHKHVDGQQADTLGGLERYSAATGGETAQRYNGSEYNYIRFTNALPYKTEPDPGPEKPVQIGQVITYEIDWRKAAEEDLTNADLVQVVVRDPLDPAVDFVSAKFEPSDGSQSWWDNTHSYPAELPTGVTASISYDQQEHQVIWKLTYPKGTDIPGIVALRVRVSDRVDFTQTQNPEVVNGAFVQVGDNPEIETNKIINPLEKSKTVNLKVLKNDPSHHPLPGASFVFYKKEVPETGGDPVNYYYSGYSETAFLATWAPLQDGTDESDYAWSSGTDGYITGPGQAGKQTQFSYLEDGTYYLKEVKAPDGYRLLAEELTFVVNDGTITVQEKPNWLSGPEASPDTGNLYTLTVPNSTGYELPRTGGSGTIWYKAGGLLMTTAAFGMYIGSRNRRRRERRQE